MRWAAALLLLAAAAGAAEDEANAAARVRAELGPDQFDRALLLADAALRERPGSPVLRGLRAEAVRGIARELQRVEGYDAAVKYLEDHLSHALLAEAYGATCAWAGREERGIRRLRRSVLPVAQRLRPELHLLALLGRYDEAAERAGAAGDGEWEAFARREAALRARLDGRARRGARVALAALAALLGAAALLFRLAPSPRSA
ncbi:MAG: hypothetical protein ACE5JG_00985 [Planctomycetota bacterium]